MSRPVVIDLTYVAARLHAPAPTGIERVDAAYARHFAGASGGAPDEARAIHYGLRAPHLLSPERARALVAAAAPAFAPQGGWRDDPVYAAVRRWLEGPPGPPPLAPGASVSETLSARLARQSARLRWRLASDRHVRLPQGALYLNVAQYAFEYPVFFRWLRRREDVLPVFFVHDLLPLDHPEFFRAGYRDLFERRVATIAGVARAGIVSSQAVGDRLAAEMARRGRPAFPLHVAPLPPPATAPDGETEAPAGAPYLLMIGTIEPRKNHLLALNLWRSLAEAGGAVPRLLLVGPRGWENEQVVDLLDRSRHIAPHVMEVAGLSTPGLARLVRGARALLMPSFAEGYGLPVAEALAAGTPVVASDIPVFREVSQGRARLLDPTDGLGWRQTVLDLVDATSPRRREALEAAARYVAPSWPDYFASIESFMARL